MVLWSLCYLPTSSPCSLPVATDLSVIRKARLLSKREPAHFRRDDVKKGGNPSPSFNPTHPGSDNGALVEAQIWAKCRRKSRYGEGMSALSVIARNSPWLLSAPA